MTSMPHSSAPHSSPLPTFLIPACCLPPPAIQVHLQMSPLPTGMVLVHLCNLNAHTAASTWWGIGKCLPREWNAILAKLILVFGSPVQSAIQHPCVWKVCPPFQCVLSVCSFTHATVFYRLLVTGQVDETDVVTAEMGALPLWSFQMCWDNMQKSR